MSDSKGSRTQLALRLPDDLVAQIDAARGDKSRTEWITAAITAQLMPRPVGAKAIYPPTVPTAARTRNGHPFHPQQPGSLRCICGQTLAHH